MHRAIVEVGIEDDSVSMSTSRHRSLKAVSDAADGCEAAKGKSPQTSVTRPARDDYFEHNFALDVQTPQGPQLDDALTYSGFDGLTNLALAPGKVGGTAFAMRAFFWAAAHMLL